MITRISLSENLKLNLRIFRLVIQGLEKIQVEERSERVLRKMKNSELWKQYDTSTKDLSDNTRKLGFASVAIIWILKGQNPEFPIVLRYSLLFVVLFFLCDIFQYWIQSLRLKNWIEQEEKRRYEKDRTIEGEYEKPKNLDIPSFRLFKAKTLFLIISYLFIGIYVFYL